MGMQMRTVVNKIIPFSSVDGPGNRTAIFLQGCNINCKYCHNPETRGMCVRCGACVPKCPAHALALSGEGEEKGIVFSPEKCISCDTCIHVCPHDSSPRTALMTPEEVYERVKRQIPFIRGITVSGGECMLRPQFLQRLFELAKRDGLGTLIDSNGTIGFAQYPDLLAVTDGVMLDIKAFSDEEHRKVTDSGNAVVLQNAGFLAECGKLFEVRSVIVPDLYDTTESVVQMGRYLAPFYRKSSFRIKLIAYRPMGVREAYSHFQVPQQAYLNELAGLLREQGYEDIVIT